MKITSAQLNHLIDQRYIERGRALCDNGQVVFEDIAQRTANAFCVGGSVYRVALSLSRGKLNGTCSCPAVDNFGPCKHMAAAGFAIMAGAGAYKHSRSAVDRVSEVKAIRQRLLDMDKEELVDLVFSQTSEEELLWLIY